MSWLDDIKEMTIRRVPELAGDDNEFLLEDLIDDSFKSIMQYSKANSYNTDWDKILVRCVAMLYNNIGTEGSVSRSSLSVSDSFDDTDVIASFIVANIPQYIKPTGYVYPNDRMKYPD